MRAGLREVQLRASASHDASIQAQHERATG